MLRGLAWLLTFQLIGEVLVRLAGVDIPGAVVGMLLLFLALQLRRPAATAPVIRAGVGLLDHLQLLFVPAGVGVVAYAALIREDVVPIAVAMLASWLLGLVVVGRLVSFLAARGVGR